LKTALKLVAQGSSKNKAKINIEGVMSLAMAKTQSIRSGNTDSPLRRSGVATR